MPGMSNSQARALDARKLIPVEDIPHRALRLGEIYSKVKLFELEDRALKAQAVQVRSTSMVYGDLAHRLADQYQLRRLDKSRLSTLWRDGMIAGVQEAHHRLQTSVVSLAFESAVRGWLGGYYLRNWVLRASVDPQVPISTPLIGSTEVSRQVVSEALSDPEILRLLGSEWSRPMTLEFEELFLKIKKSLNLSMSKGYGIDEAVRELRKLLGTSSSPGSLSGTFGKLSTLARTYILEASNQGSVRAYWTNRDILQEMQHLTASDERVCPQCRPLNGTRYPLGEFLVPPRNTHPNCRCTVIPVLKEGFSIDAQLLPQYTFSEFLLGLGISYVLQQIWGEFT